MAEKTDDLSNEDSKNIGAVYLQFSELIDYKYADKRYLDSGISTEKNWKMMNLGLTNQIEGFWSARSVIR